MTTVPVLFAEMDLIADRVIAEDPRPAPAGELCAVLRVEFELLLRKTLPPESCARLDRDVLFEA